VFARQSIAEGFPRFPSTTAAPMNDTRDIGEQFAWTSSQSLIGSFRRSMANEFRNRFPPYGSGTLNLLVKVGIQAETSHA
jgi:hypothetical protein